MSDEPIGRDGITEALWNLLARRNVLLVGQRRVGKSRLLDAMEARPRAGARLVRVDLEGLGSVTAALTRMTGRIQASSPTTELLGRVHSVTAGPLGFELSGHEPTDPWRAFERTIATAADALGHDRLVIALDEVPWWLDRLDATAPGAAREALAQLRYLADDHRLSQVGWVLTGSVGLGGRAARWGASAEINHLEPMVVPPLDGAAGRALFEVEATAYGCSASEDAAAVAHRVAGGLPYWIKALATGTCATVGSARPITAADVHAEVERRLGTLFRQAFQEEMRDHFARLWSERECEVRDAVLDHLAPIEDPPPRRGVVAAALARLGAGTTSAEVEDAILRLIDEFYLVEDGNRISFGVPLYARWWSRWAR